MHLSFSELSSDLQSALSVLTVFPSDFAAEFAVTLPRANHRTLRRLLNAGALIESGNPPRYRIPEPIHAPAEEALVRTPALAAEAYQTLTQTVSGWLAQSEPHLNGSERQAVLDAIDLEYATVRLAWDWASAHQLVPQLRQALESLGIFLLERRAPAEAHDLLTAAVSALRGDGSVEGRLLLAALHVWRGRIYLVEEKPNETQAQTRIALGILDSLDSTPTVNGLRGEAHLQMGHAILDLDVEQARGWYQRAQEQFDQLADRWNAANALAALAHVARMAKEPDTARRYDEEALALREQLNVRAAVGESKCDLAIDALAAADLTRSRELFSQAMGEFERGRNTVGILRCRAYLALLDAYAGHYDRAANAWDTILPSLAATWKTAELAHWTAEAAWVQLACGDWAKAVELAREALAVARAGNHYATVARAHVALGAAALAQQDTATAGESLRDAGAVYSSLDRHDESIRAEVLAASLVLHDGEPADAARSMAAICDRIDENSDPVGLGLMLAVSADIIAAIDDLPLAFEVYAAAEPLPYVTDSALLQKLVGRCMDARAEGHSADGMAAAEHRGRRRTPQDAVRLVRRRLTSYLAESKQPYQALPPRAATKIELAQGDPQTSPTFTVRFFGGFTLLLNGTQVIEVESTKGKALLAYLLSESPQGQSREALATLLWPNTDSAGALRNLRQTIFNLRQTADGALEGSGFLTISRYRIGINLALLADVDLYHFREKIAATAAHTHDKLESCAGCIERLVDAVAVYQGDFLAGLAVSDSEPFEHWRLFKQEELFETALRSLRTICNFYTRRRHSASALRYLQHLLRLEPWNEEAHRQLMTVYARDGRRSAALHQYETCQALLRSELDVAPSPETVALFEQIRDGLIRSVDSRSDNPYKGLNAFGRADAPNFHGRKTAVERLLALMVNAPLLLVVGPPASGKTSIIEAGLAPSLFRLTATGDSGASTAPTALPPSPETIVTASAHVRPGATPMRTLLERLTSRLEGTNSPVISSLSVTGLLEEIDHGRIDIWTLLMRVARLAGAHQLLLHIDQFEEIFSLAAQPEIRRFLQFLTQPQPPELLPLIRIVISLRADTLTRLLDYPRLAGYLQDQSYFLAPMSTRELTEIVTRPAEHAGVHFEPGLVERLLRDAGQNAATLPLLQFALLRLWEEQENGILTHAAYDRINGVGGALAGYAEQVYASLTPQERELMPRLLLRMVRPGQVQDMRRPTARTELGEQLWPLADKLVDMRLITTGTDYSGVESVELIHDALIDRWERLRNWIDEDRTFQRWHQQMRHAASLWIDQVEDEDTLLRGAVLAEAEEQLRKRGNELDETVRLFVRAGLDARARAAEHRRRQENRSQALKLALKAQLAQLDHRKETALALALAAAQLAADDEDIERILADIGYESATRRRLQSNAGPLRAVFLAEDTIISAAANGEIAFWPPHRSNPGRRLQLDPANIRTIQYLPKQKRFAVTAGSNSLYLVESETGSTITTLSGHKGTITALAVTPDEDRIISASSDQTLIVWSTTAPHLQYVMAAHGAPITAVAVNHDGTLALSGDAGGTLLVWDLENGQQKFSLTSTAEAGNLSGPNLSGPIRAVAFGQDGRSVFACVQSNGMLQWDLPEGAPRRRLPLPETEPTIFALDDSGRLAFVGAENGAVLVMDLAEGRIRRRLSGHTGSITALLPYAAGNRLISSAEDGTVRKWDLHHGAEKRTIRVTADAKPIASLDMDPEARSVCVIDADGRLCLASSADGALQWTAEHQVVPNGGIRFTADGQTLIAAISVEHGERTLHGIGAWARDTGDFKAIAIPKEQHIRGLAVGNGGNHIIAATENGAIKRWDRRTGLDLVIYDVGPQSVEDIAVSPDGETLLVGLGQGRSRKPDYSLRLLQLATGVELQRYAGHQAPVHSVAFSPDGTQIVSCSRDTQIRLWTTTSGEEHMAVREEGCSAQAAKFSPDGCYLLTSSAGSICLWRVAAWSIVRRYTVENAVVTDFVMPNGSGLFAAYDDGSVREWRVDDSSAALMQWLSHNRYVRPLTERELAHYLPESE